MVETIMDQHEYLSMTHEQRAFYNAQQASIELSNTMNRRKQAQCLGSMTIQEYKERWPTPRRTLDLGEYGKVNFYV